MSEVTINDILTDAIRYWEPRRIAYHAVLVAVVVAVFAVNWPVRVSADLVQRFIVLAVLANVAYCAAYIVDVAAQLSAFRSTWQRYRRILFGIGIVFASILARFIAAGMFSHAA